MKRIGIFGASGYMGGEALKLILEHPEFEPAWATSRSEKHIASLHRNLAGAGAEPDKALHHPEIGNNILPYNVIDHRHIYEMEQELARFSGEEVRIHFSPAYGPITRGILSMIHVFPKKKIDRAALAELFNESYKDDFFIRIIDLPRQKTVSWQYMPYPWVAAVSGTNFCHIGFDIDSKRYSIVIFSVLDGLGKGGAHAAAQNLNLMFGFAETLGLTRYGSHPY